jgi:hypothetical protein
LDGNIPFATIKWGLPFSVASFICIVLDFNDRNLVNTQIFLSEKYRFPK